MLVMVSQVPDKHKLRKAACRIRVIESFLASDYEFAEYQMEGGETPRRAYNGLLMAIKRQYAGRVAICWRHGRVFLKKLSGERTLEA